MRSTMMNKAGTQTISGRFSRAAHIALWILQVVLAVFFLLHGWLFVAPSAEMAAMIDASIAPGLRIFIGVAELLAAAGLILPGVTRILPWLTACAAAGLMLVMASATVFHTLRGEIGSAIATAAFFALVTLIAVMRWKKVPITAR